MLISTPHQGGRSYGEDLTRAMPDGAPLGVRETVEAETGPPTPREEVSHLVHAGGHAYPTLQGMEGSVGEQGSGAGQVFFEQPYMSQEWDAAMFGGWDLGLLSEADVQMEWDGVGTW